MKIMIQEMEEELIEATFISEGKGRFNCEVLIDNKIEKCYVASSAKLEQFLKLKNKKVLLTVNSETSKARYTLWSVRHRKKQILLNLMKVNQIIEKLIITNLLFEGAYTSIQRERTIENYKCDLLLFRGNVSELIEIKTVISTKSEAFFPSVTTTRAIEQLIKIKVILSKGFKVKYLIVCLSPFVKSIKLNDNYKEYKMHFMECVGLGMEVIKLKLEYKDRLIRYERL
jgi:sugar fermentation stimulation protein A